MKEKALDLSNCVTEEEVHRVLDVGRLLLSVLTSDELSNLRRFLDGAGQCKNIYGDVRIGNTSVT